MVARIGIGIRRIKATVCTMTRHLLRGGECSWGFLAAALRRHGVKKGQWYHSNCGGEAGNAFTAQTRVPKTALLMSWWAWEAGRTVCQPLLPLVFIPQWLQNGLWLCACYPSPRVPQYYTLVSSTLFCPQKSLLSSSTATLYTTFEAKQKEALQLIPKRVQAASLVMPLIPSSGQMASVSHTAYKGQ